MKYLATLIVAAIVITAFAFGQSPQTGPLAKGVNNIAWQGSGTATVILNALAATTGTSATIPVTGALTNNIPSVSVSMSGTLPAGVVLGGVPTVIASGTVSVPIYNTTGSPQSSTNIFRATVFVPLINP